jgi:hypothetical protein
VLSHNLIIRNTTGRLSSARVGASPHGFPQPVHRSSPQTQSIRKSHPAGVRRCQTSKGMWLNEPASRARALAYIGLSRVSFRDGDYPAGLSFAAAADGEAAAG